MFEELLKKYLHEWHTKKQILKYLKKNGLNLKERDLRRRIEAFNRFYFQDQSELYIAHSCKGYLLTADAEIIAKSISDDKKRALKLLKRYQKTSKKLSERNQMNLEIYPIKEDIYELLMTSER